MSKAMPTVRSPSSLMVIDDNPALLEAARALDSKFGALVERVT